MTDMRVAVGEVFYAAHVDDEGSVHCDEKVVTSIRQGYAHTVARNKWTFDKSGKLATGIADCWRASFRIEWGPPSHWAKSKTAAYGNILPEIEASIKRLTKLAGTIRSQQTRSRPIKSKAREGGEAVRANPKTTTPNPQEQR